MTGHGLSRTGHVIRPRTWIGPLPEPSVRSAEDLREVLAQTGCRDTGAIYFMYRDVARSAADREWLAEQDLRFDITVIPPRILCGEYVKTKGHYHPSDPAGTGYPEIYEVLAGEAHYLIQTPDCSDVVLITATAGDVVVVPPGYGHVTINPSRQSVLEMANIVSSRFSSNYRGYEDRRGAAYYELASGEFVRNAQYRKSAALRFVRAGCFPRDSGPLADPLYQLVRDHAPVLNILNEPEKYRAQFRDLYP